MILISTLSQLSFGSTFERFLPIAGHQTRRFVLRAYALCTVIALVLAMLYLNLGMSRHTVPPGLLWRGIFVVATILWTVFALQEPILVGLRESRWVPVETIAYSLAKLMILPVILAQSMDGGIFLAWNAPVLVAIVAVNWFLFAKRIPEHEAKAVETETLPTARELVKLAGAQYSTVLVSVVSPSVMSLIIITKLGSVANAHYYLPAQIASGAAQFLWSINRSFLVEASSDRHALRMHARVALRSGLAVLAVAMVIGLAAAPWILRIFGADYASSGSTLLRLMLLALPGYAIASFYSSFAWLDRRVWWMAIRDVAGTIVYFIVVFLLIGRLGINAVGIASIVEAGLMGVFFLPTLVNRYRLAVAS